MACKSFYKIYIKLSYQLFESIYFSTMSLRSFVFENTSKASLASPSHTYIHTYVGSPSAVPLLSVLKRNEIFSSRLVDGGFNFLTKADYSGMAGTLHLSALQKFH